MSALWINGYYKPQSLPPLATHGGSSAGGLSSILMQGTAEVRAGLAGSAMRLDTPKQQARDGRE
jgi:hypothetical protein